MSEQDQRRSPRISASIEIRYEYGAVSRTDRTMDLSVRGLYIVTASPLEIGTPVAASFNLPGFDHDFIINGRVVRNRLREAPEGPAGMGIEFLDITKEDERVLLQFVVQSQLTQKGY